MLRLAKKIFGSSTDREVRGLMPRVQRINALEPEIEALTDEKLRERTVDLRERVAGGASLDSVLEEAFAVVREAARRSLGLRPFDVQLVGGMILHSGDIAEMKTGEGKTLVAVLPAFLNALTGKGVHVVTVNDYLAKRDAEWMGQVYRFLGLKVGVIVPGLNDAERREAYAADVTYGTNNEFGFDYLRDNMKYALEDMTQRGHNFAIVDEVDSILIDESRTPLIISGPTDDRSDFYRSIDDVIPSLVEEDYEIDEKARAVSLTEEGNEHMEDLLREAGLLEDEGLYDIGNVSVVHHINQALRAHMIFKRDTDYIVKNGQVVLIDEFTGRMMEGRRLSEGLHQAIEAKEKVEINPENVTLASITFQNYFRLYDKLAGMTGTASTEESEFGDIYGLRVFEVPTNRPIARLDDEDEVYRTALEKFDAIATEIADAHTRGQPVLVGTVSIDKSEKLSELLGSHDYVEGLAKRLEEKAANLDPAKQADERQHFLDAAKRLADTAKKASRNQPAIPHQVLNARYHEQEAAIISQAGQPGAVTIATNMAGRGTDIQLGGNIDMAFEQWLEAEAAAGREPDEATREARRDALKAEIAAAKQTALDAGGLYVLGSERHESRRIDNQLRGRTGRQGDPGRSKFFISVEDDLLRIFASDRLDQIMRTMGMREGESIVHPWMSKALETSQKKVEQRNFEIRKNLLKYDDVINDQRKAIFEQRIEFMSSDSVEDVIEDMRHRLCEDLVATYVPPKAYAEQWRTKELAEEAKNLLAIDAPIPDWAAEEGIADEEILERLKDMADKSYAAKVTQIAPEILRRIEKQVLLQTMDLQWREHLQQLDHLRSVIHLRGYAQRDPLNEFKTEAFALFERLLSELRTDVTRVLTNLRVAAEPPPEPTAPTETVESRGPAPGQPRGLRDPLSAAAGPGAAPGGEPRRPAAPPPPRVPLGARDPAKPETWGRVGRNEVCPCGSGKKYKHCHGKIGAQA